MRDSYDYFGLALVLDIISHHTNSRFVENVLVVGQCRPDRTRARVPDW